MNPRHNLQRTGRYAVGLIAVALLATACSHSPSGPGVAHVGSSAGSGSSSHAGGSPSSPSAVAYSACMRSHAVPNFPDPTNSGQVPKADAQQLGVSGSQLQAAQQACAHLIPPTGSTAERQQETQCAMAGDCSQAVVHRWMSGLRTLAQCLRSHGEPTWPDPIIASLGGHPAAPHFPYDQAGIDHHSSQVLAKVDECVRLTGFQGLPLP
jgi:hypothetical protein